MLYDLISKEEALSNLQKKLLGASDSIIYLTSEGYIPNKNKTVILNWTNALIGAYKNVDCLSEEQCIKLNVLYNRIIRL